MTWREIIGRYKGSIMGLFWSFAHPLLMLTVYTFVFTVVFEAKWGIKGAQPTQFPLILFSGLIVHGLLAEVLNQAPTLITRNPNYVKKVIFPLEILPVVSVGSAVFHSTISLLVLFVGLFILNSEIHWTLLLVPIVLLPLIIFCTAAGWLLASIGVYLRDVGQLTGILSTVMLFTSPIFFPLDAIPEDFKLVILFNPLTFIVEEIRAVLIWGNQPHWLGLFVYGTAATAASWGCFKWFQKTRTGFADVL